MQNDAKLGMLAGVLGVIVVATISGKPPGPLGAPGGPASAAAKAPARGDVAAPASLPVEANTSPVLRTRPDVPANTTARRPAADYDD